MTNATLAHFGSVLLATLALLLAPHIAHTQQSADLTVRQITVPGAAAVTVEEPLRPSCIIDNLGPAPAANIFVVFRITNLQSGAIVYNDQATLASIGSGASATVTSTTDWTPLNTGPHSIVVNLVYPLDQNPSNNGREKLFTVSSESGLISLAEAVDILNSRVLDDHPRRDSLLALHISPPQNPADSIIAAGFPISTADSPAVILQYEYPVYLFFVDLYPELLFSHPVELVMVSAIDGSVARQSAQLWPEINGITPDFGPSCFGEENPRRVRGNAVACAPKANPYQPVNTANNAGWAIAVVGKLNKDIEKTTVDHDICKWKERINGSALGPGVTGANVDAYPGENGDGLTKQELCDAIDALKGKACDKLFFKYVGHGTERGVILHDSLKKGSVTLPWSELVKKLNEVGARELCIEITACHSGAIIRELEKAGIKGVVVTSSSTGNTTPVGEGDGTYWEKALEACSKDERANLNRDGHIDLCELYAWVEAQGSAEAKGPRPQIRKLSDSLRYESARTDRVATATISTDQGSIRVVAERVCMRLKKKVGRGWRDSVVYRGAVYLVNENATRKSATRSYRIVARCGGKDTVLVERIRPTLDGNARICVSDFPNNCTGIRVEGIRGGVTERKDEAITQAAADEPFSSALFATFAHDPGTFGFYRHEFDGEGAVGPFSSTTTGPSGWEVYSEPIDFSLPASGTQDIFTGVFLPDTATVGGNVITALVNTVTDDTLRLRYQVLLEDTLAGSIGLEDPLRTYYHHLVADGAVHSKRVTLGDVRIDVSDALSFETLGASFLRNVIIDADSGRTLTTAINVANVSADWEDVVIRNASTGLSAYGGNVALRNVAVGMSDGNGFTFAGTNSNIDTLIPLALTLDRLKVFGAGAHGLAFSNTGADTVEVTNAAILFADVNDILVDNGSHVACVDCDYRDDAVTVRGASSLTRYGTLNVSIVDTADNGLPGVPTFIYDMQGNLLASSMADAEGYVYDRRLLVSRHDASGYMTFGPYVVEIRQGNIEMRDTVAPTAWTQVIFVVEEEPTSVPVAGENVGDAAITAVIPQPATRGEGIALSAHGVENGKLDVTIVDVNGREVWHGENLRVSDGRIDLEEIGDLAAGTYVVRVALVNGRTLSTTMIVR